MKDKNTLYESAQAELQALYHRVFDGPSESNVFYYGQHHSSFKSSAQGFPEDDKLEYDLNEVIKQHEKILEQMNAESRAAELLARASREMDNCQKSMQEALGYSRYGACIIRSRSIINWILTSLQTCGEAGRMYLPLASKRTSLMLISSQYD